MLYMFSYRSLSRFLLRHGTSEVDVWRQDFKAEAGRKDRSYPSDIFQAKLSGVILELLSEGEKTCTFSSDKRYAEYSPLSSLRSC